MIAVYAIEVCDCRCLDVVEVKLPISYDFILYLLDVLDSVLTVDMLLQLAALWTLRVTQVYQKLLSERSPTLKAHALTAIATGWNTSSENLSL